MKIGFVLEESQRYRMQEAEEELRRAAERYGHTVYNYTTEFGSYPRTGLVTAILLNSGAVDFVVTGCGTGEGAIIATDAFDGVQCGYIKDPTDATMFREINMGNAAAIPFTKNYGNEGRLNLRYVFDRLFCPMPEKEEDYYIGKELVQVVKDYKDEWDKLKKIAQTDICEVLRKVDALYLKQAIDGPVFREHFYANCRNEEIAQILREKLA